MVLFPGPAASSLNAGVISLPDSRTLPFTTYLLAMEVADVNHLCSAQAPL